MSSDFVPVETIPLRAIVRLIVIGNNCFCSLNHEIADATEFIIVRKPEDRHILLIADQRFKRLQSFCRNLLGLIITTAIGVAVRDCRP